MLGTQLLLFLLTASSAQAAQTLPAGCENIMHSQQVHQCAQLDRKHADESLRQAFEALNARIRKQWQADAELQKSFLEQIVRAQRLWSMSVKADCTLESFEIEQGTRAYEATFDSCVAQRYRVREAYLDGQIID